MSLVQVLQPQHFGVQLCNGVGILMHQSELRHSCRVAVGETDLAEACAEHADGTSTQSETRTCSAQHCRRNHDGR